VEIKEFAKKEESKDRFSDWVELWDYICNWNYIKIIKKYIIFEIIVSKNM